MNQILTTLREQLGEPECPECAKEGQSVKTTIEEGQAGNGGPAYFAQCPKHGKVGMVMDQAGTYWQRDGEFFRTEPPPVGMEGTDGEDDTRLLEVLLASEAISPFEE